MLKILFTFICFIIFDQKACPFCETDKPITSSSTRSRRNLFIYWKIIFTSKMSFTFGAKSTQSQPTGSFSGGFGGGGFFGAQSNFLTTNSSPSPSTLSTSVAPITSSNNLPSFSNPVVAQPNVNTGMECCQR